MAKRGRREKEGAKENFAFREEKEGNRVFGSNRSYSVGTKLLLSGKREEKKDSDLFFCLVLRKEESGH